MKQKFAPLVLFLLAFFCAGIVHFVNHNKLREFSTKLLRNEVTVLTSDDASYLAPPENFLAGEGWESNTVGKAAIATRSPGYGLLYIGFRLIFPVHESLMALVIFQILLFAVAVALIPQIAAFLNLNNTFGFALAFGVALIPTFSGFLSYTLTEAVTPSLVLIFLYGLFRFYHNHQISLIPVTLLWGFLILVRPPMIIWVFAVLIIAAYRFRERMFRKLLFLVIGSLIPIFIWQLSISLRTGQPQSLHPIYHSDSNDLYRPLHGEIWNFHKSWGQTGPDFNATVNALWADALHTRDPQTTISEIIKRIDKNVINLIGQKELRNAYLNYFEILKLQVPYANLNLPVIGISNQEKILSANFIQFRSAYIQNYWFHSNVVVPVKIYLQLGFHSNLSLFIFQKTWRGNFFMEILRYFSFLIHFSIFICFPFALMLMRKSVLWLCISIPVLIYLGYICIVQRGFEERYTLPVLIPMLLVVAAAAERILTKWKLNSRRD